MRSVAFREGNAPAPESGRPAVLTSRDGLCSLCAKRPAQEDTGPGCRGRVPSMPLLASLVAVLFRGLCSGKSRRRPLKTPRPPGVPAGGPSSSQSRRKRQLQAEHTPRPRHCEKPGLRGGRFRFRVNRREDFISCSETPGPDARHLLLNLACSFSLHRIQWQLWHRLRDEFR